MTFVDSLIEVWHDLTRDEQQQFILDLDDAELDALEAALISDWDYRADPAGWVKDKLGEHLWSKQVVIAELVRDQRLTVVRSGHGTGKTRIASRIVAWWADTHPPSDTRIVTTATTFAQVRNVLWQEIASAHRSGRLKGRVTQTEWHIVDDENLTEDDRVWMKQQGIRTSGASEVIVGVGRKPSDYDQSAFQGVHARYVLVVIDEADGVPEDLFVQAQALATGPDCRILAIGNPVDPASYMAKCSKPGSGWATLTLSCLDLPTFTAELVASEPKLQALFDRLKLQPSTEELPDDLHAVLTGWSYVEQMLRDYCQEFWRGDHDSPFAATFLSRVLGEYPDDATDGVIPRSALLRAKEPHVLAPTDLWPVELGVDVGAGGDLAVIRARFGVRLSAERWTTRTREPEQLVDLILRAVQETQASVVKIDAIGWGWGIAGSVRRRLVERQMRGAPPVKVVPVFVSEKSADPVRFFNIRSELWWTAREMLEGDVWDLSTIQDDDPVWEELAAPRYVTRGTRIVIEQKTDTRKRLKRSPDDADAVNLAFYTPPATQGSTTFEGPSRRLAASGRR
jgi:hypothetical protein